MDQFFVQFLLLSQAQIIGVFLLLVVVGGILGAVLFTVKASFRRVTYLWFLALSNLAMTISQAGWTALAPAAKAGSFSLLMMFLLGCFVLFGVALYYGSAARSNDIDGSPRNAWIGFVPLLNLWLLFTRGGRSFDSGENRGASSEGSGADPLLIIGALVVFALSSGLSRAMERSVETPSSDRAALEALLGDVQTLEERFAKEASVTSRQLPLLIDLATELRSIEAEGKILRMTYRVSGADDSVDPNARENLAAEFCKPDMFAFDLERGGRIVSIYKDVAGQTIAEFEITSADCASLN